MTFEIQQQYDIQEGPLARTYGLFVPETINTGAEISIDRITDAALGNMFFYTANLPLATKREGKLLLGMGGRTAFNAVFGRNTERVCQELIDTGYVHLSLEQRDLMLCLEKSGEVVFVAPEDLNLREFGKGHDHIQIRTGRYERDVTTARMPFVQAGYGSGDQLRRVMGYLKDSQHVSETTIFTMSPDHAAEQVQDGEMVGRASWLDNFSDDSSFDADDRDVYFRSALRGVRGEKTKLEKLLEKSS